MIYIRRRIFSVSTDDQPQLQKDSKNQHKITQLLNLKNPTLKIYKTVRSQFFNKYKFYFHPNQNTNTKKKTSNFKGFKRNNTSEKRVLNHYNKIQNRLKQRYDQLIFYGQYLKIPSFKNTTNYQFYQFSFKSCAKMSQKLDRFFQLLTCIVKNQKQVQKIAKKISNHFISLNAKLIKKKKKRVTKTKKAQIPKQPQKTKQVLNSNNMKKEPNHIKFQYSKNKNKNSKVISRKKLIKQKNEKNRNG